MITPEKLYCMKKSPFVKDVRRKLEKQRGSRTDENIIAGRNAVSEALRAGRAIDSLYISRGEASGPVLALVAKAKEAGAAV